MSFNQSCSIDNLKFLFLFLFSCLIGKNLIVTISIIFVTTNHVNHAHRSHLIRVCICCELRTLLIRLTIDDNNETTPNTEIKHLSCTYSVRIVKFRICSRSTHRPAVCAAMTLSCNMSVSDLFSTRNRGGRKQRVSENMNATRNINDKFWMKKRKVLEPKATLWYQFNICTCTIHFSNAHYPRN